MNKNSTQELEKRLAEYRAQRRYFWFKEFPLLAALCAAVAFGMSYLAHTHLGPMIADWRLVAALFSVAVLIPPVWMMAPEKPTYEAVEYDKVLGQIGALTRAQQSSQ